MLLLDIGPDFDLACKAMIEANPQLGLPPHYAKDHERRPVVLRNLSNQILALERRCLAKKKPLTRQKRYQIIAAAAQIFIKMAVQQRDQSVMSEADKYMFQRKDSLKKEVESLGIVKEVKSVQKDLTTPRKA